jgi:hypothetical protein
MALIIAPIGSRTAQRLILATASFASTCSPSWNFKPGRSRNVQMVPAGEISSDSIVWRRECSLRRFRHSQVRILAPQPRHPIENLALIGLEVFVSKVILNAILRVILNICSRRVR